MLTSSQQFEQCFRSSSNTPSSSLALQDARAPVLTFCEHGVCDTCLTPEEQAANDQFLPCCSRAHSERLVLDL